MGDGRKQAGALPSAPPPGGHGCRPRRLRRKLGAEPPASTEGNPACSPQNEAKPGEQVGDLREPPQNPAQALRQNPAAAPGRAPAEEGRQHRPRHRLGTRLEGEVKLKGAFRSVSQTSFFSYE